VPPSKRSALQEHVLIALSGLQPAWTLTGGAALAGFHTQHRETRDLDLFFHHERTLGPLVADATHALLTAGMSVTALLAADPTPIAEPAQPSMLDRGWSRRR
jgi:hypothetical protein